MLSAERVMSSLSSVLGALELLLMHGRNGPPGNVRKKQKKESLRTQNEPPTNRQRAGEASQTGARPSSVSCVRLSVRPSTHLSASSHWRRALMSASSTLSNRVSPLGIVIIFLAPCGGEDTSGINDRRGNAAGSSAKLNHRPQT